MAAIVDIAELRAGCAPIIACYERLLAGHAIPLADLDRAVARLDRLPAFPGRLGRAIALLAAGGRDATTTETVAALELLRTTPALRPPRPAATRRRPACIQSRLFGL